MLLKIKLGLKTEATWITGFGHLKRLQNLVAHWQAVEPLFISSAVLPKLQYNNAQVNSAADFVEVVQDLDILIVDEPELDLKFLRSIPSDCKVVGFDELGLLRDRLNIHFATTLLGLENFIQKRGITTEYIGPNYFIFPKSEVTAKIDPNRKILITFGGSDPAGLSLQFLENMSPEILQISSMVLGPAFSHSIKQKLKQCSYLSFLDSPASLVPYYKAHPITVTGGGVSAYEAILFGSKVLLCSQHEEQSSTAMRLVKKDAALEFGVNPRVKWSELRALLTKCIEQDSDLILPMNPSLFDEKGVYRVREILETYAQS